MPDAGFRVGYSRIGDHRRRIDYRWIAIVVVTILGVMVSGALVAVLIVKGSDQDDNTLTVTSSNESILTNRDFRLLRRPPHRDGDSSEGKGNPDSELPPIPNNAVDDAYQKALDEEKENPHSINEDYERLEDDTGHNSSHAVTFFRFLNAEYPDLSVDAVSGVTSLSRTLERTTSLLKQQFNLSADQIRQCTRSGGLGSDNEACRKEKELKRRLAVVKCREDQLYRTLDGTCNNLLHPSRGAADSPYRRGLQPDYADGVSLPRASSLDGATLPGARRLSAEFHSSRPAVDDARHSSMSTFWGQFVAHDITKVKPNLETSNCCQMRNGTKSKSECFPIRVSTTDEFYSLFGVTCLEFVRSVPAEREKCALGPREQVNQVTSYLDGSLIYGSSLEESLQLRTLQNGLLKSETVAGEEMLPSLAANSSYCAHKTADSFCYRAGDGRCNENLMLTSLHTLFSRHHNRVATQLLELNVGWDDERLFQETRRLLVAQIQHITYTEYLPRLLGSVVLEEFDLSIRQKERSTSADAESRYEQTVDASISNEFASAAFRFGHATVPGLTQLLSGNDVQMFQLHRGLTAPAILARDNDTLARLLNGAVVQRSLRVDPYVSRQLSRHLFQSAGAGHGLDLVSINIQRGRDHGIPGYNAFRAYCGLPSINTTHGYMLVFDTVTTRFFTDVYRSVDELDLYVGGLAEPSRTPDGALGPVFACLVADQFARLRGGDRFWYENDASDHHPHPFTADQLEQVRRTTLARLMCDNVPALRNIQPDVFATPTGDNSPVACAGSRIPSVDLLYWENQDDVSALFADVPTT